MSSLLRTLARDLGRLSAGGTPSVRRSLRRVAVGALALTTLLVALALVLVDPLVGLGLLVLVLAAVTLASAVEVVQAYEQRALTVFGEYRKLLTPGLNVVPPFVSRTYRFDLRTRTVDVPRQEAITRDNSPVTADAVVFIRVTDPKRAFLEVDDYERAVASLAQTTLRAVIGDMDVDDTLSRRDEINARIRRGLEGPTDAWGVRVESVEVQEVLPSRDVTAAMEEQTSAERRRRATILEAQGERRSAVERAEGEKQSNVVRAEGAKQAAVLEAQGDAVATVLRARAAESMGERAVVDRGMEALRGVGQGASTTYVLPQELTSLLGRYGRHLTDGDAVPRTGVALESGGFDDEMRQWLGLDDVDALVDVPANSDVPANGETVSLVEGGRPGR